MTMGRTVSSPTGAIGISSSARAVATAAAVAALCGAPAVARGAVLRGQHVGGFEASASASATASAASSSSRSAPLFESLDQCAEEVARLTSAGCGSEGSAPHLYRPWENRGRLVDDDDGNKIVHHQVREAKSKGRMLYKPPTSYTGVPSESKGWDYRHHGDDWGGMGECGGPWQSPVDLDRYVGVKGQTKSLLWFDYYLDPDLKDEANATLFNDGHGLRYEVRPNGIDLGFVKVGAREYVASEYMFHAPSEHSIDGAVFPLELQIYNQGTDGGVIGISVFFREGASNPFLAGLRSSMSGSAPVWTMQGRGVGKVQGKFKEAFNLEALIPKGDAAKERTFYNYQGSLTFPPCTSGVDWWVLSSPITASREEIRFVKQAIFASRSTKHGNARASMPLGNRTISVGLVGFQHAVKGHQLPSWRKLDEYKQPRGYPGGDAPWGPHWVPKEQSADDDDDDEDENDAAGAAEERPPT